MIMEKTIRKYTGAFKKTLEERRIPDAAQKAVSYKNRLTKMYASEIYKQHNIYPTMNVPLIYAVIAMCLELKGYGLGDSEIMDFTDEVFKSRKKRFEVLLKIIDVLPNSYRIAEKWNLSDHEKRVRDGSVTYDVFEVSTGKIEYCISECMYVKMFEYYGIRRLCKIFCITDEHAYANLAKHVKFVRHSDLSDGPCCHDEIFDRQVRLDVKGK